MSEEIQETQEASREAEKQAFDAIFQATPTEATNEELSAGDQTKIAEEPEVPEVVEEQPVLVGMTESQLKAKFEEIDKLRQELERNAGKVNGKFGELTKTLNRLQELKRQQEAEQPQVVAKLERLRAQGYDELASSLEEDLKGFAPQASRVDPEKIAEQVEARVSKAVSDFGMNFFESQHPDWKESIASEDYDAWRATLSPEEFQKTETSNDLFYASGKLHEFKSWREDYRKQKEKQQADAQAADRITREKKQRLEAAVIPQGRGVNTRRKAVSEEEAFNAVFRKK